MFPQGSLFSLTQGGYVWSADAQTASTLSLNTYVRFKITNPENSGRTLAIYCLGVFSNNTGTLQVFKNPTTSVTTNVITPVNLNAASTNASVATLAWDTSASNLSGGSLIRRYGFSANSPIEFSKEIYLLPPGNSLGMTALLTLTLANQAMAHLTWVEVQ